MKQSIFSLVIGWLAFFLAIYSCSVVFMSGSILWIPIGITLVINFSCLLYGTRKVAAFLAFPGISFNLNKVILLLSSSVYFICSMNGLIALLFKLPFYDKSFLLFPIIISSCFFAGASINLSQSD